MITRTIRIFAFTAFLSHGTVHGELESMKKNFKLDSAEIERLVPDIGSAFATDMITVKGKKVDYMVRHKPQRDGDSGWVFYGGGETQEYLDDPSNTSIFSVNTIANYDPGIIGFLTYPPGTEVERNSKGDLQVINPDIKKPEVIFFYPVDEGVIQVTINWSFYVSTRMLRRYDKSSLVIWRPGFTIWINAYSPIDKTIEERIKSLLGSISPERHDLEQVDKDGVTKIHYRLEENVDGVKQSSAYIFGLTENQEIHITVYFDDQKSIKEIEKILETLQCKCA